MDSDDQGVSTPGAALLLVVGEPFSEEQKTLILLEITKGFRCWDVDDTGIDINEELAQIANRASLGEEGINGERLIQHQSDNLAVEILINPLAQTLKNSIKKLLIAPAPTKYIIYAGYAFQGSGAWVLQDDTFTFNHLAQVFKNIDVENALKQNIEANLTIHTLADSNWGTSISKADFTNNLRIQLNPPEKLHNIHGVVQFTAYVGGFVRVVPIISLLQASEQFGNISFTRPTLYIFPGCQGDSALFGVSGFNLLVNGGYSRRACFWDFARHLDRVDAMLMTHLGTDNIFGLRTVLQRKSLENVHPQIGYLYMNVPEKSLLSVETGETDTTKEPRLLINLTEEANKVTQMAKQLGISPFPCSRSITATTCEPVNLYHKLGHGSLDMYILNPVTDSKELKEFYQLWSKQAASLDAGGPFSLPYALSVCALLVWKPYKLDDKIVRILFPGNAPQHKIIEGFEKVKSFGFLKIASCTARDLIKPAPVKKPLVVSNSKSFSTVSKGQGKASAPTRGEIGRGLNIRTESPRKETKTVVAKAETKSPTKSERPVRDELNRKNLKEKEKPKAGERESKPKSAPTKENDKDSKIKRDGKQVSAPSPAKATSPVKSPSPTKSSSPPKSPRKTSAAKVQESKSVPAAAPAEHTGSGDTAVINHEDDRSSKTESDQGQFISQKDSETYQSLYGTISEARDAVGAVDDVSVSISSAEVEMQKLEDLSNCDGEQLTDYASNGKATYAFDEEKPQALPEPPVMLESPSLESEAMPDYSSKIESDQQELSEFSRVEEELMELEGKSETDSHVDPAQEIPISPEPSQEEQPDSAYQSSVEPHSSFETPVFTNDVPDTSSSLPSVEKNIQYGIDDSSYGRDMGGIQEVDEEEHDDGGTVTREADVENYRDSLHEMTHDEDETNGFDKDSISDDVDFKVPHKNQERSSTNEHLTSVDNALEKVDDGSLRQVQGGFDEGIEADESSDKDSSPENDISKKHLGELSTEQGYVESEDRDSLDGGIPEDDRDVSGATYSKVNGSLVQGAGDIDRVHGNKSAKDIVNPFIGVLGQEDHSQGQQFDTGNNDEQAELFDPIAQWGQPMGLPSPPTADSAAAVDDKKGVATSKSNGTDKPSGTTTASKGGATLNDTRTSRHAAAARDVRKRPATAPPIASSKGAARPGSGTKRPGTASSRASAASTKIPLPPMTSFYVDLTYIPNHGDPAYSDVEFFKRIRARNYVLSTLSPNPQVLDSLVEAKGTWENKDLEVTIIPTYDSETLRHWMGLNKEKLQESRIDMAPAVSRCTIQLQDLETSLPAFRLEV